VGFTGSAEDRLKIRERIDAYSDAVTRCDVEAYLACWTEDGERRGSGGECRGKPALREHWDGIWQALERMAFLTQVGSINVDGDRATARSYCLEIFSLHSGEIRKLVGTYDDELVRVGGEWLFARRNYQVLIDSL
jgi:ketosteroid isomerase-like protein